MRKRVVTFLALFLLAAIIFGTSLMAEKMSLFHFSRNRVSQHTQELIDNMRNDDVVWRGDFVGIRPREILGATSELQKSTEDITPLLIDALLDENRFVVAHVLLTWRMPTSYPLSGSEWNGLKVQLHSDGKVTFTGNNLAALHEYWVEKSQR